MKLVNYRCAKCEKDFEEYFYNDEEIPEELPDEVCEDCGGKLVKWNFKKNDQVWHWEL